MPMKRSAIVTVTSIERAITKLYRLRWTRRMHKGRINEAANFSYPYASVGLAGIGSYHTDCRLRLAIFGGMR